MVTQLILTSLDQYVALVMSMHLPVNKVLNLTTTGNLLAPLEKSNNLLPCCRLHLGAQKRYPMSRQLHFRQESSTQGKAVST